MDTLVYETDNRLILTNQARIVRAAGDVSEDTAASWKPDKANPFLKWIAGDFVESDAPNTNTQFWTKDDLAKSEHTIKFSPLNMVHKTRQPVGFVHSTKSVDIDAAAKAKPKRLKIEALSAMWSHVFPFESALVDAADEAGLLFYSMECRGTHLHCAGDNGCDETFEYDDKENHCEHLLERSSIRHIVNPTFRGSALIIPPIKPGWKNAKAGVLVDAVSEQAARFAEQTADVYEAARGGGSDLSASTWEHLMATIVSMADA